jgi:ABC-type lipoprotein release transport system permease subunit
VPVQVRPRADLDLMYMIVVKIAINYFFTSLKSTNARIFYILSCFGLSLSLAILIFIGSVANGFTYDLKMMQLNSSFHVTINNLPNVNLLPKSGKIQKSTPFVKTMAVVQLDQTYKIIQVIGLGYLKFNEDLMNDEGDFPFYSNDVFVDHVRLFFPPKSGQSSLPKPSLFRNFGPTDIQSSTFNLPTIITKYKVVEKLSPNTNNGVAVWLVDPADTLNMKTWLEKKLPNYRIETWQDNVMPFVKAINMQKMIISIIFLCITVLAIFCQCATTTFLVLDKRREIAVLRTLGLTKLKIALIFLIQSVLICLIGIILGLASGILLSLYLPTGLQWIEGTFGVQLFNPTVFLFDYLPSKLNLLESIKLSLSAVILNIFVSFVPCRLIFKQCTSKLMSGLS